MSTQTYVLGMNCKLYYGEPGAELAEMTELTNVKDLTSTLEKGETDVTTRANQGWEATAGTLKKCTIEWGMQWKPGDAGFEAILTAWLNNTGVELAILDGGKDVVGSQGPKGTFSIISMPREEPLTDAVRVSVTAKLDVYDEWVMVEA